MAMCENSMEVCLRQKLDGKDVGDLAMLEIRSSVLYLSGCVYPYIATVLGISAWAFFGSGGFQF